MIGRWALILAAFASGSAFADDAANCDRFKWSVARERALIAAPAPIDAKGEISVGDKAYRVTLAPAEAVKFAVPPERAPKAATHGAALALNLARAGVYQVTLSDEGWIDVAAGGALVHSTGFTGVKGCPGVRKSVRFDLGPGPATLQISNVEAATIDLAVVTAAP